jgi:hypothetical protein
MIIMDEKRYRVAFKFDGLTESAFRNIEWLRDSMQDEIVRVYNIYANKTNNGLTKKLSEEFNLLNPNYFEDNKGKEWTDFTEYNTFISKGYERLVVDDLNKSNISPLLDFYVDPDEIVFTGQLKVDHKVTISFYLK